MIKIPWSKSIWFFDVDDTLVDTASNSVSASEGIRQIFESRFNSTVGKNIQTRFNQIYNLMYQGYKVKKDAEWDEIPGGKEAYEKLNKRIADYQKGVVAKYGTYKKWSREIFIKLAIEDLGIKVSPEFILESADAYWMTLTKLSDPFPQALQLVKQIKQHGRPIYLITSSDARLKMKEDGQFEYIPKYSEALKRKRVTILRNKGIEFNNLSIGDPEDKPHLDFFQKGIKIAEQDLDYPINLKNAIMVGDSFAGDLQTPKEQMGFGMVILFQKDRNSTEVVDPHQIITNRLNEITDYFIE